MASDTEERIKKDLKDSLRSGDSERLGVLRLVVSEMHNRGKEKQAKGEDVVLAEEEVSSILQKESKKRKDAIELFRRGGREDLAVKEEKEISIISAYLPEQASEEEIEKEVEKCVGGGPGDFGAIMREVSAKFKGRADGKQISLIVKKKLGKQ